MDAELLKLVQDDPDPPAKSVLEPHSDLIRELRLRRRPYRQIAKFLAVHRDLHVHWTTIHAFVKVRARGPKHPGYQLPSPAITHSDPQEAATIDVSHPSIPSTSAELAAHIETLKRRKRIPPPLQPKRAFYYEPGEPLRLITDSARKD
jgi:hypothetical protein